MSTITSESTSSTVITRSLNTILSSSPKSMMRSC
jgi:hypothetical protein